jgi:hypothetical protein
VKTLQSLASAMCQIAYLAQYSNVASNPMASPAAQAFFVLNIIVSIGIVATFFYLGVCGTTYGYCNGSGSNSNVVLDDADCGSSYSATATAVSADGYQFTDRASVPHIDEDHGHHGHHEDHVSFVDVYGGDASGAAVDDMGQVELSENPMHSAAPATATKTGTTATA